MKTEDFERLKAVCEKEGFEVESYFGGKTAIVGVKDPWGGVEFASNGLKIHKIKDIDRSCVYWTSGGFNYIVDCSPSTEQAYVKQLKKEAFERFGEINIGDAFDRSKMGFIIPQTIDKISVIGQGFSYDKIGDQLFFGDKAIYNKGKWAERVKERVKVEFFQDSLDEHNNIEEWGYVFKIHNYRYGCEKSIQSGQFLTQQLEKYLNNEI